MEHRYTYVLLAERLRDMLETSREQQLQDSDATWAAISPSMRQAPRPEPQQTGSAQPQHRVIQSTGQPWTIEELEPAQDGARRFRYAIFAQGEDRP